MVILKEQSMKRGLLAFFATDIGRKITMFGAGTAMVGLFLGNFAPHTIGLQYYKDFVQSYENGIPRPIPEKVKRRLELAIEKLNIGPFERKFIKPFTVFGFDLFNAGSTKYRSGCIIGIPVNYSYDTVNDIRKGEIVFQNKSIDWNSESGKLLKEAIVLKEDEQIFGLCKTILQCQNHDILLNASYPTVSFLAVYSIGNALNRNLNLFTRHFTVRLVMYSILGCFGVGSWFFMKDFNQVNSDADVDKKLSNLGPEFVDAGRRYYDKALKKNMALRSLLQDNTYTAKGNLNYMLRQKSMPLTARKLYFEQKLKELQGKADAVELSS